MLTIIILSFTLAIPASSTLASSNLVHQYREVSCKPFPEDPWWPSEASWAALNESIDGRLLAAPPPPGAVCYQFPDGADSAACAYVTAHWKNGTLHADNPVSTVWPYWSHEQCVPPKLTSKPTCDLSKFPPYVVNATSAAHVKAAVDFATKTDVRLNIKNTGHDFQGRSYAAAALYIWTHHIRQLDYHDSFSRCGKPATAAYTAGAGMRWGEVYALSNAKKKLAVGGADPSVGVAGWLQGGGHSGLSAKFGLGVDNAVEMEVVTPTGQLVTANECKNTDLFWAMRGGGGGFGVMTSVTFKLYDDEPMTTIAMSLNSTDDESAQNRNNNFWDSVAFFHGQMPSLSAGGLMGQVRVWLRDKDAGTFYRPGNTINDTSPVAFIGGLQALSVPKADLEKAMKPFVDHVASLGNDSLKLSLKYQELNSSATGQFHPSAEMGSNTLVSSRLLDEAGLKDKSLQKKLRKIAHAGGGVAGLWVTGPGVRARPVDSAAVSPAWRTAQLEASSLVEWPVGTDGTTTIKGIVDVAQPLLSSLSPKSGCYVSENNPYNTKWKEDFWGQNYPRLATLKKELDPKGHFWCSNCAGSEGWSETAEGRLCRT